LKRRLRPEPAARYVHPNARDRPSETGEHDHNLDVADQNAPNYLRWIADLTEPYLGQRVLELGAGIGSITELWAGGHEVVASDLSDPCVAALHERFDHWPNVSVSQQDVRELREAGERFDSVVMINVLEHIEDDAGVLDALGGLLTLGGNIIIYVPALNGLYGAWDHKVGHYRRYSRWRLREVGREAGLRPLELRYVNLLAIPAWIAFSRSDIGERTTSSSLSIWDRTGIPASRAIEARVRVPVGLNVLGVLARN
jgi:SAM-dependent methyltransferase